VVKILRTFNNHNPSHIVQLTKFRHLVEVFSYCISKGVKSQIINNESVLVELREVISVDRTYLLSNFGFVSQNYKELLREFYPKFFVMIFLDQKICLS